MKPTDKTPKSQNESLAFIFDLEHPPEKVWRALTEPELLGQWLLPVAGFRLESGASFTLKASSRPEWDGTVNCQLLEIDPPHKISYSWVVGELNTVVTFSLTPTELGTHMTLVHSGFKSDQKQNFGGARYGWKMMGERLVELIDDLS